MPVTKIAISVEPAVVAAVDRTARQLGLTRSAFITRVLRDVAAAETEADIRRRIHAWFQAEPTARGSASDTDWSSHPTELPPW